MNDTIPTDISDIVTAVTHDKSPQLASPDPHDAAPSAKIIELFVAVIQQTISS